MFPVEAGHVLAFARALGADPGVNAEGVQVASGYAHTRLAG